LFHPEQRHQQQTVQAKDSRPAGSYRSKISDLALAFHFNLRIQKRSFHPSSDADSNVSFKEKTLVTSQEGWIWPLRLTFI
jgi:hypothetical protein